MATIWQVDLGDLAGLGGKLPKTLRTFFFGKVMRPWQGWIGKNIHRKSDLSFFTSNSMILDEFIRCFLLTARCNLPVAQCVYGIPNIRWGRFGKTFWHRREHRPALAILWKEGELEFFVAGKKHVMNNFGIAKRWANHLGTRKKKT